MKGKISYKIDGVLRKVKIIGKIIFLSLSLKYEISSNIFNTNIALKKTKVISNTV